GGDASRIFVLRRDRFVADLSPHPQTMLTARLYGLHEHRAGTTVVDPTFVGLGHDLPPYQDAKGHRRLYAHAFLGPERERATPIGVDGLPLVVALESVGFVVCRHERHP